VVVFRANGRRLHARFEWPVFGALRPFVLHRMRRLAKALSFLSSTSILAPGRRISVGVSRAGCGDLTVRRRIRDRNDRVGGKLHRRGGGRQGVKLEQPMFIGEGRGGVGGYAHTHSRRR